MHLYNAFYIKWLKTLWVQAKVDCSFKISWWNTQCQTSAMLHSASDLVLLTDRGRTVVEKFNCKKENMDQISKAVKILVIFSF